MRKVPEPATSELIKKRELKTNAFFKLLTKIKYPNPFNRNIFIQPLKRTHCHSRFSFNPFTKVQASDTSQNKKSYLKHLKH